MSAEITLAEATAQTRISDLVYSELSPRVANYLIRNGVATIADLVATYPKLGHIGFGRKMRIEVDELLARWGMRSMAIDNATIVTEHGLRLSVSFFGLGGGRSNL